MTVKLSKTMEATLAARIMHLLIEPAFMNANRVEARAEAMALASKVIAQVAGEIGYARATQVGINTVEVTS